MRKYSEFSNQHGITRKHLAGEIEGRDILLQLCITPKIKEQMKTRDKNLRRARKTRCDLDWALFRKSKTETFKMN